MIVRAARPNDYRRIRRLAESLGLDYADLENDRFWLAEDERGLAGIVGLKRHADSDELVALGVDPVRRRKGLGRRLVAALLDEIRGDVHLATIIPHFFAGSGFETIPAAPAGMKKDPSWCEGCPRERCTIMVWKSR